jgi:hypothetical protein
MATGSISLGTVNNASMTTLPTEYPSIRRYPARRLSSANCWATLTAAINPADRWADCF